MNGPTKIGNFDLSLMENKIKEDEKTELRIEKKNFLVFPEPLKKVTKERFAIFINEVTKAASLSGFAIPEEEEILLRARTIAEELPEIPEAWISETYRVARKYYAADPKIYHLAQAWRDRVSSDYRSAKAESIRKKKEKENPTPPPMTEEETFEAWREVWLDSAARGGYVLKGTLEKYGILPDEIEQRKKEIKI